MKFLFNEAHLSMEYISNLSSKVCPCLLWASSLVRPLSGVSTSRHLDTQGKERQAGGERDGQNWVLGQRRAEGLCAVLGGEAVSRRHPIRGADCPRRAHRAGEGCCIAVVTWALRCIFE